nr:hypothetical protein [Afipia clevelandensis]
MMPKHHPLPLSGGDRKALKKELAKSQAMAGILADRAAELRAEGERLTREADKLTCESWNEKMWSAGGPTDPSPTIGQALNGGFSWLEVQCSRCRAVSSVDLAILPRPPDTPVHALEDSLRCQRCTGTRTPTRGTLQQLSATARRPA